MEAEIMIDPIEIIKDEKLGVNIKKDNNIELFRYYHFKSYSKLAHFLFDDNQDFSNYSEEEIKKEFNDYFKSLSTQQKIKKIMKIVDIFNHKSKCSVLSLYNDDSCLTTETIEKLLIKRNYYLDLPEIIKLKKEQPDKYRTYLIGLMKKEYNVDSGFDIYKAVVKRLSGDRTYRTGDKIIDEIMSDPELLNLILKAYKPFGPVDGSWLDNVEILSIIKQYEAYLNRNKEYKFYFGGVYPSDFEKYPDFQINEINKKFLDDRNIKFIGVVLNHDKRGQPGSHWVGLYIDLLNSKAYYYDSVGKKPKVEYVNYVKHLFKKCDLNYDDKTLEYNKTERQTSGGSCGIYAISFIISMASGINFNDYLKLTLKPEFMKYLRLLFFNDKNELNY